MRVLHIIPSLDPALGGPAAAILPMANALAKYAGLTMTVTGGVSRSPISDLESAPGVDLVLHSIPNRASRMGRLEMSPRFLEWIARNVNRYDLVHTHGIFTLATSVCRLTSAPVGEGLCHASLWRA